MEILKNKKISLNNGIKNICIKMDNDSIFIMLKDYLIVINKKDKNYYCCDYEG
jgi:hypothetical protein